MLFIVFLLFSITVFGQAGLSYKYRFGGEQGESNLIQDHQNLIINYSVSELSISGITNSEGNFYRITIPGHMSSADPGKPELPVLCRLITLPEGTGYNISISEVKMTRLRPSREAFRGLLYPVQEGETKQPGQTKPRFLINKSLYASRGIIPSDTVRIEKVGVLRGNRIATLLISPVHYNPGKNTLEVITSMKIDISFAAAATPVTRSYSSESVLFAETLDKSLLNYGEGNVVPGFSTKPVKMVILTDSAFRKQLLPFFKWKTQKGFNLQVLYKGTGMAGTTYTQLKDTLRRIYNSATPDNPAPEYLLIIGDVNRIPKSDETNNISDMYYGEFTGGGDYIPEMFIGRIPVSDTGEVRSVVNKIIQYEKFAFADTNKFYNRALISAGNDVTYSLNMNGQLNYVRSYYLKSSNNITEYHFYYPQSTNPNVEDSIKKLFKKGISFMNYTGHGDAVSWLDPLIRNKDVDSLKNKNMYPFIISNACRTAQFSLSTSLGNRMVLAKEKGAIGFIGCANDSYWDEDYYWAVGAGTVDLNPSYQTTTLGAYDRFFHINGENPADWYYTMGQINYAGNMSVSASTSQRKKYYWETYNLIGDPSMIPIIGKPAAFGSIVPDTIPNGMQSITLTSEPFSYVAFSHADTLWDASFASASGSVELTMPGISNDSCLVVVTGQNRIPLIKTVRIANIKSEYICLTSNSINDSQGNNNKMADFGETFFLNLSIRNLGLTNASGLYAKISTTSDLISISKDSVFIGTMNAKSGITLTDDFQITVSDDIPDLAIATVDLKLKDSYTEKHYKIDIRVHAPMLSILSCTLDDSTEGNGNNIADPGETFSLIFKVTNQGSSSTSGQFYVTSHTSDLAILEPDVKSGELKLGETTEIPVRVKLSESAQTGSYMNLTSLLDCTPYILNRDFTFRAGKIRESFESSSFTVFPWVNISAVPWTISASDPYDGTLSARSGKITHNQNTSLIIRAAYEKEDSLKFYYMVSSELDYDNLVFSLNDKVIFKDSGEKPWTKAAIAVPAGINKMEWKYVKDQSVSAGEDAAWVDMIDFAGTGTVSYIEKDLQVARIVAPVQKNKLGKETVSVKVLNLGREPVTGFNLAYYINDLGNQVKQTFNNTIMPFGDSVTVTFKMKADLSRYGNYDVVAYSYDNSDDYLANDTLTIHLENHHLNDSITVYPNPSYDRFSLFIQTSDEDKLDISVVNNVGSAVYNTQKYVTAGMNTIEFSDLRLSPGIYYLKINGTFIARTITIINLKK